MINAYKYNFFCYVLGLFGIFIAFVIIKDTHLTIISLLVTMFNYILYRDGKKEAEGI